jgi:DamX protein
MAHDHFAAVARRLLGQDSDLSISAELMPDGGHFFFEGGQRLHSLETLRHLINFGDMILLVSGEPEIGKSALLREMSEVVKDEVHVILMNPDATEGTGDHDLIMQLAHQSAIFESPSDSPADLLQRCTQSYVELRAQSSKRTVIVVDDFERYKEDELRLLIAEAESQEDDGSWVLVLAGVPTAVEIAQAGMVKPKEKLHVVQLKSLTKQETKSYVNDGLKHVGIEEEGVLSETALQWLHLRAKGLPGRIEGLLASALFNVKDGDSSAMSDVMTRSSFPTRVLALIVAALLVSFLFVAQQHKLFAGLFGEDEEVSEEVDAGQNQRLAMLDRALEQSKKFDEEPLIEKNLAPSPEDQGVPKDSSEVLASENSSDQTSPLSNSSIIEEQVLQSMPAEGDPGVKVVSTEKRDVNPRDIEPEPEMSTESVSSASPKDNDGGRTSTTSTATGGSDKSADKVSRISVRKDEKSHPAYRDSRWISTKPGGAYTMQVLGSYKEETAKSFIDQVNIDKLIYVETTYKGKPWYVVLYGEYPSADLARDAKKSLPEPVAKEKPWVRSLSGISAK